MKTGVKFGKRLISIIKDRSLRIVLLCLIGATTFWFFNALNKDYSTSINYPIRFSFEGENVVVMSSLPDEIVINVSGGGWNLLRKSGWLSSKPVVIPLQDPAEQDYLLGASLIPLISDQLNELQLNYVITDSLYLDIDHKGSKRFKVVIDSLGIQLRNDFYVTSPISTDLDSVTVTGPQSVLDTMSNELIVRVRPVNIDDNFDQEVAVDLPDRDLMYSEPPRVITTFSVEEYVPVTRDLKLYWENFPSDSSIYLNDSTVTISFRSQISLQDRLDDQFRVVADLNRIVLSDSTIQPIVREFPDRVMNIEINSGRVKVHYE